MTQPAFKPWPKIPRLRRGVVVTEKIDGTNGIIYVHEDLSFVLAGSRSRWLTEGADNFGFAAWVAEHAEELKGLGSGYHYGEWWGRGIQRGYGLEERRFSLFNTARWNHNHPPPECCRVVPVLGGGELDGDLQGFLDELRGTGSRAAPGFMKPEGVVVFHPASQAMFKVLLDGDDRPKGAQE